MNAAEEMSEDDDLQVFHHIAVSVKGPALTKLRTLMGASMSGRKAWAILKDEYASASSSNIDQLNNAILDRCAWRAGDSPSTYTTAILTLHQQALSTGSSEVLSEDIVRARIERSIPRDLLLGALLTCDSTSKHPLHALCAAIEQFSKRSNYEQEQQPAAGSVYFGKKGQQQKLKGQQQKLERKCWFCDSPDHVQRDCSERKKAQAAARAKTKTNAQICKPVLSCAAISTNSFLVDSGSNNHIVSDRRMFTNWRPATESQGLTTIAGNQSKVPIKGVGTVNMLVHTNDGIKQLCLHNVVHVPESPVNILAPSSSVSIDNSKIHPNLHYDPHGQSHLQLTIDVQIPLMHQSGLPVLQPESLCCAINCEQLHSTMGHLNYADLRRFARTNNIQLEPNTEPQFCKVCALSKAKRASIPKQAQKRITAPGQIIHTDLNGPFEEPTIHGGKYAICFIDDCTRFADVFIIRKKSESTSALKEFIGRMNARGVTIGVGSTMQSDSDQVFKCGAFHDFLLECGITPRHSPPHSQAKNGIAERYFNTILDTARALLIESQLSKKFAGAAMKHAAFLRNLSPHSTIGHRTPHAELGLPNVDITGLPIFGTPSFVHIPKQLRRKFDAKSREGIYIGEDILSNSHRVYIPETNTVISSIHVQFGPMLSPSVEGETITTSSTPDPQTVISESVSTTVTTTSDVPPTPTQCNTQDQTETEDTPLDEEDETESVQTDPLLTELEIDQASNSRVRKDNDEPDDLLTLLTMSDPATFMTAGVHMSSEPTTLAEVKLHPEAEDYMKSYDSEVDKLMNNDTWTLIKKKNLPAGTKIIGVKPVFKRKTKATGEYDKHKTRIVAKGYQQRKGIHYNETFAPVIRHETLRLLIAVTALLSNALHHVDVSSAFTNADLEDKVYTRLPEGVPDVDSDGDEVVGRLNKCLYGLVQSNRGWNKLSDKIFKDDGWTRLKSDTCLYVKKFVDGTFALAGMYVDDYFFSAPKNKIEDVKKVITSKLKCTDYGTATSALGLSINVDDDDGTISLSQENYIMEALKKFGLSDCKVKETPMTEGLTLTAEPDVDNAQRYLTMDEATEYRSALGTAMYSAMTMRPDIAYTTGKLARYMAKPTTAHMIALKHLYKYLKGTAHFKLTYSRNGNSELIGYADASFGGNLDTKGKSTGGYAFLLAGAAISWRSKLQSVIALSTAEAEYMALSEASRETMFLRHILQEIDYMSSPTPTTLFEDNQPAIKISNNPVTSARTKHVNLRYHFVRERVEDNDITIKYIDTENMVADIMTKALGKIATQRHVKQLFGNEKCTRSGGVLE